ncbi:hypothetical protein [Brevibacillus sp. SIMBA_040]|uniref:hypothetical protein n=1 Tax=unclassified Brevibacillus TaxID=2684853 RepID=UPI00397A7990
MFVLSEQAQTILADAGWYEGRNIDVTETVTFLEAKGYDVWIYLFIHSIFHP